MVCLGVPCPPFQGNPLDPPLRSRFQARRVDPIPAADLLPLVTSLAPTQERFRSACVALLGFAEALNTLRARQSSLSGVEQVRKRAAYHAAPTRDHHPCLRVCLKSRTLPPPLFFLLSSEQRVVAFHHMPYLGEHSILSAAKTVALFPTLRLVSDLLPRVYPWPIAIVNEEATAIVTRLVQQLIPESAPCVFC